MKWYEKFFDILQEVILAKNVEFILNIEKVNDINPLHVLNMIELYLNEKRIDSKFYEILGVGFKYNSETKITELKIFSKVNRMNMWNRFKIYKMFQENSIIDFVSENLEIKLVKKDFITCFEKHSFDNILDMNENLSKVVYEVEYIKNKE